MNATFVKSDAQIREDVIQEIERDPRFEPAELGVEVDDGIVTLGGTVSSYEKVLLAADIAATVGGVKGVANELILRRRGAGPADDAQIAKGVRDALRADPIVPDDKVELIVRDGVATLGGKLAYTYQRRAAVDSARRIYGVRAVHDQMLVAPPRQTDDDIRRDIESALRRCLPSAARDIDVRVRDGVVTLTGNVRYFTERRQAEKSAWMTEAVRDVINSLTTTW